MTTTGYILPLIGLVFIVLALYHLVQACRATGRNREGASIARRVRKRLAMIFMIVGVALLGLFFLHG